jgi:hypothetical protein
MYVTNVTVTSQLTDVGGNVFVFGSYSGSGTIYSQGSPVYTTAAVYVIKPSNWAYGITGASISTPSLDASGNVSVCINGGCTMFNQGGTTVFQSTSSSVLKFLPSGSFVQVPISTNVQLVSTSFDTTGNLWAFGNQYGTVTVLGTTIANLPGTLGVQFNSALVPLTYVQLTNTFVLSSTSEGLNVYAVSTSTGQTSYYWLNGSSVATLSGTGSNVTSMVQISASPWAVSSNSVAGANAFAVVSKSNVYLVSSIGSLRTVYQGNTLNTTLPSLTSTFGTSLVQTSFQGNIQSVTYFDGASCNTAPCSDSTSLYLSLKSRAASCLYGSNALAVQLGNSFIYKTTVSGQTIFGDSSNPNVVPISYSRGLWYAYQPYQDSTGNITNEIGSVIATNPIGTTNVWINSLFSPISTPLLLDITSNLAVGANLVATSGSLRVAGNIVCTGDVTGFAQLSDRRLKTNLAPLSNCLDLVMDLNPVEFTWNESEVNMFRRGQRDIGLIAQDVPDVVTGDFDGYRTVRYERLVPYLIGAIQELAQACVSTHDKRHAH